MQDRLDEVLTAGVERGAAPGVSAVVVDREGVRYAGAAGERMIGSGVAMTTDTVGSIFSMTKAITGAALMQLVEQGRVDLDDAASKVCPELGELEVLDGFDDDGQPQLRPPTTDITLRHLLTHTSGLVYEIWNANQLRWMEATGAPTLFSLLKQALRTPLAFDPGTDWEYGIGIDWAGQMLEAITGQTLGDYFAEHLTGPLGMTDTAFEHTPSMLERASAVHGRMPDGSLSALDLTPPEAPEFQMGGGGLNSTMPDYGRFLQMMLNDGTVDGTRVLDAATVQDMARNHIGELRVKKLTTVMPNFSNDAELFPGEPKSWGLTFQISETPCDTGRPAGTLMWAGLANSYYWIDRAAGVAGAYMTQILPFADEGSVGLFYEFEKAVYDSL